MSKSTLFHFARAALPTWAVALTLVCGGSASAASLVEGFETFMPAGWSVKNNSEPLGSSGWFQGRAGIFSAHSGAANSYAGADFNNTADAGVISNWLITPTLSFNNGDTLSFYTRTVDPSFFPDRLEVRFSSVGGSDVGAASSSVGTFTNLLLSVNPDLTDDGYPKAWTVHSATITGLAGATNGAIGFRYFVTDGGPLGNNSEYIGIDSVLITAVPEPTTWALMALGLGAVAWRRKRV